MNIPAFTRGLQFGQQPPAIYPKLPKGGCVTPELVPQGTPKEDLKVPVKSEDSDYTEP